VGQDPKIDQDLAEPFLLFEVLFEDGEDNGAPARMERITALRLFRSRRPFSSTLRIR